MPLGTASVDGRPGLFGIDTGNAGTVILFGSFLRRSGLMAEYGKGIVAEGHGTGGGNSGQLHALRAFTIAGTSYRDVPAFFTEMKSGSFSSWTEAGNFGYEILSRFIPTFNYSEGMLYLERSPLAHGPPHNRAGLAAYKNQPDAFDVVRVAPNGPAAAAGVAVGDRIVGVEGQAATGLSYGDFYARITDAKAKTLHLVLLHAGKKRSITLQLTKP
jgi:hypothetical protein